MKSKKSQGSFKNSPQLLVSDTDGNFFEIPELLMAGMSLGRPEVPSLSDIIPVPDGSDLFRLPGRKPVGYDPKSESFVELDTYDGVKVEAVAAFMSPAYLQTYHAAYKERRNAPRLPLYCYSPAGWNDGVVYTSGLRIDSDQRQDYKHFDPCVIEKRAKALPSQFPGNRLVEHLVNNCVLRYGCPAARNFVMGRWECPIPTSRVCNAECLGCISNQPCDSGFKASHDRISFTPTVEEIVEYVSYHLENAPRPVASFGQGCEGEPLLEGELLAESIKAIRKRTQRGIINVNTNGSLPAAVKKLCDAGLDSIRVSLSSAREEYYNAYYRPRNYSFDNVIETLSIVNSYKRWSSINYLMFPGFTDTQVELDSLEKLIKKTGLKMIQTRNLNIDPLWYIKMAGLEKEHSESLGVSKWVTAIKKNVFESFTGVF
ncbi:MAG TPA: radical SAM protein [Chitinispirillaceae bacterium]|nr:radical SAM protein [Chitinispirillaceae bacterium]